MAGLFHYAFSLFFSAVLTGDNPIDLNYRESFRWQLMWSIQTTFEFLRLEVHIAPLLFSLSKDHLRNWCLLFYARYSIFNYLTGCPLPNFNFYY